MSGECNWEMIGRYITGYDYETSCNKSFEKSPDPMNPKDPAAALTHGNFQYCPNCGNRIVYVGEYPDA